MKYTAEKYNELCSEFMGLLPAGRPYHGAYTIEGHKNVVPDSFSELFHSEMEGESWYVYPKFDSDWNWIMEVIEKIESIKNEQGYSWQVVMYQNAVNINNTHYFNNDITVMAATKKESVVQAIWEFLNWYNQQKEI